MSEPEDYPLKTDGGTAEGETNSNSRGDSKAQFEPAESQAAALVPDLLDDLDRETSREFEERASRMARNAELQYPVNASSRALAAGSVYASGLLVNEKVYQDDLADASGVSTTVIRRVYTEILNEEGMDFRNSDEAPSPDEAGDDEQSSPLERVMTTSIVVMTLGVAIALAGDFLLGNTNVMSVGATAFAGGAMTATLALAVGMLRGDYSDE